MTEGINIFHDFLKGDGDWSKNKITLKTNIMGRQVVISNRSVYHKYAEVTIEIPDDIKDVDISQWLFDNELEYTDDLDTRLSEAEYNFGFGIGGGMDETESESETRYDVVNEEVKGRFTFGGHL
jgi:hypothetical protein